MCVCEQTSYALHYTSAVIISNLICSMKNVAQLYMYNQHNY